MRVAPLGPDSDLVCSDLERDVSITTQLLREKPGGGPSGTRTSDRSCTVRHATQPHRLRLSIQSRPKKGNTQGCDRFRGFEPRLHRGRRRASAGAQSELGRHASGPAGQVGRAYEGQARLRGAQLRVAGPNASLGNARSITSQARTARESPHLLAAQPGASPASGSNGRPSAWQTDTDCAL